jgi:hypothetical protein
MLSEIGLRAVSPRGVALSTTKTRGVARRVFPPTVESLNTEIERVVAERQALRAAGADAATLEENRRRLGEAQTALSRLLIERHLPHRLTNTA